MISTDKKFIFIAVMKTGTMSITNTLSKYSIDKDGTHYTASELKSGVFSSQSSKKMALNNPHTILYKENWDNFFTFGFVRNPWDHFVSLYKWCKKHNNPKSKFGFDLFLENEYRNNFNLLWDWNFTNQSDRLYEGDEQIVDFVGRFENIEKDFDFICKSIGVEEKLSFINRSPDRREYKDFYKSKEQIKMIEEMYAKDLERFGYGFE